jgi:hypothetical protein
MYQVQIPWNKVFKGLKYLLILLILLGIGYVGYLTYYYATNSPQEVRVTNLTGSSATVSWYTNRPDGGVVYVKDKNSFTPVFSKFGSTVAYDDRDVAIAQEAWVNKQVSKATNDVDADYEVTLDEKALNELPVKKKGKYYVHHVTINNLQEEKQYYFRVGNGVFMWNVNENNQKYSEYEAPTVKEFGFKTYKDPENLPSPSPIYGTVYSLARNKDGLLMQNINTDSIVFVHGWKEGEKVMSNVISSITNKAGGWTLDKSNVRDSNGAIDTNYKVGEDKLYAYVQLENVKRSDLKEMVWGITDAPAPDLLVNNEAEAKVLGSIFDVLTYKLASIDVNKIDYTFNTYAIDNRAACEAEEGKWVGGKCSFEAEKPIVKPPTNNNTNYTNTGNASSNNCVYRFNGVCIEKEPEEIKPPAPVTPTAVAGGDNSGGNTSGNNTPPATTPTNTNLSYDCPDGKPPKNVGGKQVCSTKATEISKTCTGSLANSCELDTKCYCKLDGDLGYAQIEGESCRPAACASKANGDVTFTGGGSYTIRQYQAGTDPNTGQAIMLLCGTDTTGEKDDACKITDPNKPYVTNRDGSIVVCAEGFNYVEGSSQKCVKDPNSQPSNTNTGKIQCIYYVGGKPNAAITSAAECDKLKASSGTVGSGVSCSYNGKVFDVDTQQACTLAIQNYMKSNDYCTGVGNIKTTSGCTCDTSVGYIMNSAGKCVPTGSVVVAASGKCEEDGNVYNCGKKFRSGSGINYDNCSEKPITDNYGCGAGYYCDYEPTGTIGSGDYGYCIPLGGAVAYQHVEGVDTVVKNINDAIEKGFDNWFTADCFVEVNPSTGKTGKKVLINGNIYTPEDEAKSGFEWRQVDVEMCINDVTVKNNTDSNNIGKVFAKSEAKIESVNNKFVIFPESGTYDIQIGSEEFKNVYIDKNNRNFFYKEVNGKSGYQLPEDPKKPAKNDDVLLPASGAVVTLYEKAKNQSMKLSKGINIVSFNYLPSRVEGKNMNAKQLMRILNSSGTKVTRITTFEGGKWLGGLAYDSNKGEIVGNDFLVLPGKGYLIVSNADYTATVPGYGIKNSIPVALSDGWNLVGVNGFSKTYTAASIIKSVNELEGVGANNVTWWPTSKGRYESFQKSEDTEYGFDFPLLKDIGYFVRINKFDRDGAKSVIWNPGGELHGENGSK